MTRSPVGVGILGLGAIGQVHAAALARCAGARLVAVAVRRHDEALAARFPGVAWHADYGALLRRADIEVVAICTPNDDHAAQALMALAAGKHVVVEKPLALTVEDGRRVVAAARERGLLLAPVSQRRLEPQSRAIREVVARGALGRLVLAEALVRWHRDQAYYDAVAWRGSPDRDGGVLPNQAIHAVDLLCWFCGPVAEVTGATGTLARRIAAPDTAVATLRFADGALGIVAATVAAPPGLPAELNLFGDRGQVALHDATIARWAVPDVPPPAPSAAPGGGHAAPAAIGILGHLRQWHDILAALREGREPTVTGEDALMTLIALAAIAEAGRTGRAVRPAYYGLDAGRGRP